MPTFDIVEGQDVQRLARIVTLDGTALIRTNIDVASGIKAYVYDRDHAEPGVNILSFGGGSPQTVASTTVNTSTTLTIDAKWDALDNEGYNFAHTIKDSHITYQASREGTQAAAGWRGGHSYLVEYVFDTDLSSTTTLSEGKLYLRAIYNCLSTSS